MAEMIDAGAEIASNQIQYSLLDRRPELQMVDYCRANGVDRLLPVRLRRPGGYCPQVSRRQGRGVDVNALLETQVRLSVGVRRRVRLVSDPPREASRGGG